MADLTDAFNDCVDRLRAGQSVDECLRAYPDRAADLRPLLETALLVRRANPSVPPAARDRVRAQVMQVAGQIERHHPRPGPVPRPAVALAASLAAIVMVGAVIMWLRRDSGDQGLHLAPAASATVEPTAATATPLPSETPSPSPTGSPAPGTTPLPGCLFSITFSSANLRQGPGTGYDVAGFGTQGEAFAVRAQHSSGLWFQVEDLTGRDVWVAASVGELSGVCDAVPVSTLPLRDSSLPSASPTPGSVPPGSPVPPGPTPDDDSGSGGSSGGDSADDDDSGGSGSDDDSESDS